MNLQPPFSFLNEMQEKNEPNSVHKRKYFPCFAGILTNCDNCEANYHVSCHVLSPPPPRLCPKCALKTIEPAASIKRNEELGNTVVRKKKKTIIISQTILIIN